MQLHVAFVGASVEIRRLSLRCDDQLIGVPATAIEAEMPMQEDGSSFSFRQLLASHFGNLGPWGAIFWKWESWVGDAVGDLALGRSGHWQPVIDSPIGRAKWISVFPAIHLLALHLAKNKTLTRSKIIFTAELTLEDLMLDARSVVHRPLTTPGELQRKIAGFHDWIRANEEDPNDWAFLTGVPDDVEAEADLPPHDRLDDRFRLRTNDGAKGWLIDCCKTVADAYRRITCPNPRGLLR